MSGMAKHPIYTHDPSDWMKLIHCFVSVDTEDGGQHQGYVYTVDPVSESLVLITNPGGKLDLSTPHNDLSTCSTNITMKIIMRPSIVNMKVEQA